MGFSKSDFYVDVNGNRWHTDYYDIMLGKNNVFCVEQGQAARNGTKYTVDNYIRIDGRHSKIYKGNSNSSKNLLAEHDNDQNLMMAWILNQKDDGSIMVNFPESGIYLTYSDKQNAMYGFFGTWASKNNYSVPTNSGGHTNTDWINKASKYVKDWKNTANASITDNTDKSKLTKEVITYNKVEYIKVGPFNWTFNGTFKSKSVYDQNNNLISAKYAKYSGNTLKVYNNINDAVKSGQNFYLLVPANQGITKISKFTATVEASKELLYANIWVLEHSNSYQTLVSTSAGKTTTETTDSVTITDIELLAKMVVTKIDEDSGDKLPNIGFRIKALSGDKKGLYVSLSSNGNNAVYTSNPVDLKTNSNGQLEINSLYAGKYEITETINPYFGYEDVPKVVGTIDINWGESLSYEAKNKRKYIKIRGYAWEERVDGKNSTKDNIWTDNAEDKRLENITVRLIDSAGQIIAQTVTNKNGEYVFGNYDENPNAVKIEIDKLVNAYIEFEYNGMSYQSINVNTQFTRNTSKNSVGNEVVKYSSNRNTATDKSLRGNFNNNYATISKGISANQNENKTYDIKYNYDSQNHNSKVIYGDNVKYGYTGQTYPISGIYEQYEIQAVTQKSSTYALCTQLTPEAIRKDSVEEIGGINLGVEEREMPDLFLLEDMQEVQISLNDYTHTYKYEQRFENPEDYAGGDLSNVSVRFANKYLENSYSREVYSSDIVYNKQPGNEGKLKIFVTYKVKITNEASSIYSNVKTLANYYDERYENVVVRDENGNIVKSEIDNSYNQNGLKRVNIDLNYLIEHGKTRELTITYQLNNDAINTILNEQLTLESVTEVTSYSSYSDGKYSTPYAGIDVDSAPDTVKPEIKEGKVNITNTIEDDTDKAPSLILNVKEGRIVKGTVWEDSAIESLLGLTGYDKERKGDGIYKEDTENIVNNVKVELMEVTDSNELELAKLYKKDETVVDASTTTTGQGEYSFVGVIPSKYVLRYTYGDNSVIVDTNGNTIENVNIDNYKSTIYRGGNKDAAEAMTDYWYRGETSDIENISRLSDAKDNDEFVQDRITEDEIDYNVAVENRGLTEISADTRIFDIKLDYDINLDNVSEYGAELKFVFDNIDFGIIERPKQSLIVDKQVANVKITLTNGNTIINGDPRVQTLSGVKLLDDDVFIEIDKEIIQGATLTVTYEISVDNSNCEIDYNNEDYYIYGTVPNGYTGWKIATVVDMFDYLPEELELQSTDQNNWERIEITQDMKNRLLAEAVYDKVKGLRNVIHLANPIFENMEPGSQAIDTSMVASRQLATSTDELTYENDVEIIKLKGRKTYNSIPGNYDPTTNKSYNPDTDRLEDLDEQDDDDVEVTITPPTGLNSSYILYVGIGLSVLIIIGIGIVLIKRKVI